MLNALPMIRATQTRLSGKQGDPESKYSHQHSRFTHGRSHWRGAEYAAPSLIGRIARQLD